MLATALIFQTLVEDESLGQYKSWHSSNVGISLDGPLGQEMKASGERIAWNHWHPGHYDPTIASLCWGTSTFLYWFLLIQFYWSSNCFDYRCLDFGEPRSESVGTVGVQIKWAGSLSWHNNPILSFNSIADILGHIQGKFLTKLCAADIANDMDIFTKMSTLSALSAVSLGVDNMQTFLDNAYNAKFFKDVLKAG